MSKRISRMVGPYLSNPRRVAHLISARRQRLVRALVLAMLAVPATLVAPALAGPQGSPPPGATALCSDGTYSFALHHSGSCSHHGGVARFLDPSAPAAPSAPAPASQAGGLNLGHTVLLARRTNTAGCVRGPEPDRRCSPGARYSGLSTAVLCSSSFHTGHIRNVPDSEKHAVEIEYGMTPKPYGRTIEIDHIIALEIGGSNVIANLHPEPGSGTANYHFKDRLENKLHFLVCNGAMTLRAAQAGIAGDWEALYERVFGVAPIG